MDPFSQPTLSPSFFDSLELTQQSSPIQLDHQLQHPQQAQQQLPGPRNYKSRKYRPCDFCRARQVRCQIEAAPPCTLCSNHGRECTFVEQPKKKRRPNASTGEGSELNGSGGGLVNENGSLESTLALNHQQHLVQLDTNGYAQQYNEHTFDASLGQEHYLDPQHSFAQSPNPVQPILHTESDFSRSPNISIGLQDRPLDSHDSRSARFIGETGESNPYLLRHYRYDENDECTVSKLTYRRIKKASRVAEHVTGNKGEPPVVFMLADDSLAQKGEPRIEDSVLSKARHDVASMFTYEEASRLVELYFRFVHPYFPILPRSEMLMGNTLSPQALQVMPLSLRSAIYATALPFMLYDDLLATTIVHSPPSAHELYRISWLSVVQELHTPRLATLQSCLLLLQRAPTNRFTTDTPWKTSLVGWTVSLAQVLGLTRECGEWASLPQWEIQLRKRLWHGVYIMDKWASLGAGMPSHIRNEDFDVLPLQASDCEPLEDVDEAQQMGPPIASEAEDHFRLLSELTVILSDIVDSFYTLRATQRTSSSFGLSLELAKPLRERLKDWNNSLPPALSMRNHAKIVTSRVNGLASQNSNHIATVRLSGNPSLSLAYIVATMTLYRALLRPLENLSRTDDSRGSDEQKRIAVRTGAKECAKEVVEFVENLGRGSHDAFWHSWSRANFAIASSFLMQLLIMSETPSETQEINKLVERWRWAMRIGSGPNSGSGLMNLGLLRLDGLLLEGSQSGRGERDGGGRGSFNGDVRLEGGMGGQGMQGGQADDLHGRTGAVNMMGHGESSAIGSGINSAFLIGRGIRSVEDMKEFRELGSRGRN